MKPVTTLIALGLGIVVNGAYACGINWNLPKNHFDGVNEFGFVSIWENIGKIDTGDGLVLPLNINFRSDRNTSSSTLGAGWHLALLDSNIVQVDERTFMMFDPAGPFRLFWRDAKNPNILGGQAGWKAEIRGDTITAWADCGGIKLVFNKGRIASMQVKEKTFTYDYHNGQISELIEGNTPILKVERAPVSDEVTGLTLANNQKIEIKLGEKPIIQSVNGINVVSRKTHSVGEITRPDGIKKIFDYSTTSKLQPTISVSANEVPRTIAWSSDTRHILSDGPWKYEVIPSKTIGHNAAISRTNGDSMTESWHYCQSSGEEVVQSEAGKIMRKKWHTSGKLSGKIRSIMLGSGKVLRFSYDLEGALLRIVQSEPQESRIGLSEESTRIVRMEDRGELSPNSSSARIVRSNISFDVYNRDDPEFDKHLSACISAINKDSRAMMPKHGDIDQIQIARTASGKLYLRILNKAGQLLFSSVNQRVYWPIKKNSST
jgi:hypothetical protein